MHNLELERHYEASPASVWRAWTEPALLDQWWGPRGFTTVTESRDFRPGGYWKYVMRQDTGVTYQNYARYLEIEEGRLISYDQAASADGKALFRSTVRFDAAGSGTTMRLTMGFDTAEALETSKKFIEKAGGDSTWDKLGEFLANSANVA